MPNWEEYRKLEALRDKLRNDCTTAAGKRAVADQIEAQEQKMLNELGGVEAKLWGLSRELLRMQRHQQTIPFVEIALPIVDEFGRPIPSWQTVPPPPTPEQEAHVRCSSFEALRALRPAARSVRGSGLPYEIRSHLLDLMSASILVGRHEGYDMYGDRQPDEHSESKECAIAEEFLRVLEKWKAGGSTQT